MKMSTEQQQLSLVVGDIILDYPHLGDTFVEGYGTIASNDSRSTPLADVTNREGYGTIASGDFFGRGTTLKRHQYPKQH